MKIYIAGKSLGLTRPNATTHFAGSLSYSSGWAQRL